MDPSAPPTESHGTSSVKEILGGRYVLSEHTGKFSMPGPDGKMMDMDFKGISTEGYDNAKKKFVSSWVDNMGTGIMYAEGDYDADSKTLTYRSEIEMMPGMKTKVRQVVKITDKNHRVMEMYEERGGTEVKTMEIAYTRKG
jgi:regulatory protein YycI of two-component signal transduction system YycFG